MTVLQQKGVELAHCHHPWTCGCRLSGQQDMSHSQSHPMGWRWWLLVSRHSLLFHSLP